MSNTFVFLRHGKTRVDKDAPISKWVLSDKGKAQVEELAKSDAFRDVTVIIASGEEKAYQTAQPIAGKLGLPVAREPGFSELNRDKGGFMQEEEYEAAAKECLENRDASIRGWETASHALARFKAAVAAVDSKYDNERVLVVGHGFTINLYFADLLGELARIHERIARNDFCDWGIVQGGVVIKDIAR